MSLPIFIDRPNDETESDCTKKQAYREAFPLQMWYFSQPIIHPSSSRSIKLQVQIKVSKYPYLNTSGGILALASTRDFL